MVANRNLERQSEDQITELFSNTVKIINDSIGKKAFKPLRAINAAVFDSLMIGIAKRMEKGEIKNHKSINKIYVKLLKNKAYEESISSNTTDKENVIRRIRLSVELFDDLK